MNNIDVNKILVSKKENMINIINIKFIILKYDKILVKYGKILKN